MSLVIHHERPKSFFSDMCNLEQMDRRRNSLADVEGGPTLEQIADETGVPLNILVLLNCSNHFSASTATGDGLEQPADHRRRSSFMEIEKGPRVEQIANETGRPLPMLVALNPADSPTHVPSPAVAEDELLEMSCKQQPVHNRWAPYPTPSFPPHDTIDAGKQISKVGPRRSSRRSKHYVKKGHVCECLHMRKVYVLLREE